MGVQHAALVPDSWIAVGVHGAPAFAARPVHDAVVRWPVEVLAVQSSAAMRPGAAQVLNVALALPVVQARDVPALVAPVFGGVVAAWPAHRARDVHALVASAFAGVAAAWPEGQVGRIPGRVASELGGAVVAHESGAPGSRGSSSGALPGDRGT